MNLAKIVVLISGNGSNLQAIIDACNEKIIPAKVVHVISNRDNAMGLKRAANANIPTSTIKWQKDIDTRYQYDERLAILIKKMQPTLIVLAGWMHLLGDGFLKHYESKQLINLHPALPGTFPGAHAIHDAFSANVTQSGVMAHTVVKEMDAGTTLSQLSVSRLETDTFDDFDRRVRYTEKTVLINGITKALQQLHSGSVASFSPLPVPQKLRSGKVRDVYDMGYGMLLIETTDRCSAFDRFICNIPNKGNIINRISTWWFNQTRHIIENHMVHSFQEEFPVMIVKRCKVFAVEFVVRGYITGTTNTSMWTLYSKGERKFGDYIVGDGLYKNQELNGPIVTPTTKSDDHDEPIDKHEIVTRGLMTPEEYDFCHNAALRLFECGQMVAAERGLILVDTKYEFGIDPSTSRIILVDELHTCDSSRYWKKDTYELLFEAGMEPERFDKDMIRVFVKEHCDPYEPNVEIPKIPDYLIAQVSEVYTSFYVVLTGESELTLNFPTNDIVLSSLWSTYFNHFHPRRVIVLSDKLTSKTKQLVSRLRFANIYTETEMIHPTRNTEKLLTLIREKQDIVDDYNVKIIFVICSKKKSMQNILFEMVSSASFLPIIVADKLLTHEHIRRIVNWY